MTPTRQHFEFARAIWELFTEILVKPFPKRFLNEWVSEQVYERLREETSVGEAVSECKTPQDMEDSFKATVNRLNRDWDRFLPPHKDRAIKLIKRYGLSDHFDVLLEMSEDELEELSIRWDIADMLFAEARRQTLEECRRLGFDLENRTINWQVDPSEATMPGIVNKWTDLFVDLLRRKMDFDLAVVKAISPTARYRKYKTDARERCNYQYQLILEELREFLLEDDKKRTHPDDVPSKGERVEALLWTEYLLNPFKSKMDRFLSKADTNEPNPDVYDRVAELVRRETKPRASEARFIIKELVMGDSYKNTGQAGAMGRNAHAHDMNFVQLWQQAGEQIDLHTLAAELSTLREALTRQAKTAEDQVAIGAVASAEIEAKKNNGPRALEYLSKAGTWAFDTATKIGVVVAGSAIKSALGMP